MSLVRPPEPTPRLARAMQSGAVSPLWWWTAGIAVSAFGALFVGVSYRAAQDGAAASTYYAVFWIGALALMLPPIAGALRPRIGESERTLALLAFGVCSYVPKFLRNPYGPLYHDEFAHERAVKDLLRTHHLFTPNTIISIIPNFPGLHIVTAVLEQTTGLGFWASATIVILTAHCSVVLAVYFLGRVVLRSRHAAAFAAVLYATNAAFLYFDTEFAYESLAISFFFWIIALTALAARGRDGRRGSLLLSSTLTIAVIMTHHLTTVFLIVLSVLLIAVHAEPWPRRAAHKRREEWWPWAITASLATVGFIVWVSLVAHGTYAYLNPYLKAASQELLGQSSARGGVRSLNAPSGEPVYERVLGFLSVLLMAGVYALAAWRTRLFCAWRYRRTLVGLVAFGALYFPSLVFILSTDGAEGARRSWDFTYVGVAFCCAALVFPWLTITWRRARSRALWMIVIAGLIIGNTGAGLDDAYRFPGPYSFGSDTRSTTTESVTLALMFGRLHPFSKVVTDRYTGLPLVAYGHAIAADPSSGFATWNLYTTPGTPPPFLVNELVTSDYTYLIIDNRIARLKPEIGTYFEPDEPNLVKPSQRALDQLNDVPWAEKVIATTDYAVYRLIFNQAGVPRCPTPGCRPSGS
jgi:hypothetical protein